MSSMDSTEKGVEFHAIFWPTAGTTSRYRALSECEEVRPSPP
jgi:hypothetical protein